MLNSSKRYLAYKSRYWRVRLRKNHFKSILEAYLSWSCSGESSASWLLLQNSYCFDEQASERGPDSLPDSTSFKNKLFEPKVLFDPVQCNVTRMLAAFFISIYFQSLQTSFGWKSEQGSWSQVQLQVLEYLRLRGPERLLQEFLDRIHLRQSDSERLVRVYWNGMTGHSKLRSTTIRGS